MRDAVGLGAQQQEVNAKVDAANNMAPRPPRDWPETGCETKAAQPHPREVLLRELNEEEQKLIEKLALLHQMKEAVNFARLSEAELLLKMSGLSKRFSAIG